MKERNIGIDILKFFAALLITNSHMGMLYGKYDILATGGAIGDVLFFFCSGFTLFLGRMGRFDNWYKRRINRIYPTVFAWAILSAFFFNLHQSMDYTIIHGGGWFVTCIMLYYVVLYFIQRFLLHHLKWVFGIIALICIAWYFIMDRPADYNMYGATYFKWGHYFLFMLLGAMMGISQKQWKFNFKTDFIKLISSIFVYYAILFAGRIYTLFSELQIISLIPLLFIVYYFYKVCSSDTLKKWYTNKYIGWSIKFIGGLCLEIYLVQGVLFTEKMNHIFPINILIMFIIIFAVAYLLRCGSRIFSQTFKDGEYDWKAVFKLI
ncbi:acyltransferase family protein [Phocaeicola plebeius]|uniref:acyltransferase family protein n=1 Tax=Phocaeicola plebeius TaxID=310297 RepID=UPI00195B0120|nr:acyltransferase [Phocaeicola plebeius]MBM6844000.1 acyltransferase [Phocaeicola plebeius]